MSQRSEHSTNGQQPRPSLFPPPTTNGAGGWMPDAAQFYAMLDMVNNELTMRRDAFLRTTDPRRNIAAECGYPDTGAISVWQYKELYDRGDIASRIIQCLPKEAWQVAPRVYDSEDPSTPTPFDEDWAEMIRSLRGERSWYTPDQGEGQTQDANPVWEYCKRFHTLCRIGHFGVLLLGFDDGAPLDQPVDGVVFRNMTINAYVDRSGHVSVADKERTTYNLLADRDEKTGLLLKSKRTAHYTDKPLDLTPVRNSAAIDVSIELPDLPNRQTVEGEPSQGWGSGGNGPTSKAQDARGPWGTDSAAQGTDAQYLGVELGLGESPSKKVGRKKKLLFMRPFDETLVQITQYEANPLNPRFGQPVMYRITLNDPNDLQTGVGLPTATVRVHWSRVIHSADFAANAGASEVFAPPALRPNLNRVLDLEKTYGGSAEGYWRMCIAILAAETHPTLAGDVDINMPQMKNMFEHMMNGMQRYGVFKGMSLKSVAPSVTDPSSWIDKLLEAICIQLGIPKRVFMGSERGELASSQDDAAWNDRLREYQRSYITPRIIVPLVDRLIQAGVLSPPSDIPQAAKKSMKLDEFDEEWAKVMGTTNAFCATGEGGGVDPSCPPGGSGASSAGVEKANEWVHSQESWRGKVDTQEVRISGRDVRPAPGVSLTSSTVKKYEKQIEKAVAAGEPLRPIVVAKDEQGKYFLHDGNHYFKALTNLKKAGKLPDIKEIPAVEVLPKEGYQFETEALHGGLVYSHTLKSKKGTNNTYVKNSATVMYEEIDKGTTPAAKRGGYKVEWPDLDSQTDAEKADVFTKRITAYSTWAAGGLDTVIPPMELMTKFDTLSPEEAQQMIEAAEERRVRGESLAPQPAAPAPGEEGMEGVGRLPQEPAAGPPSDPGNALTQMVGGITGMAQMFGQFKEGIITRETLKQQIMLFYGVDEAQADALIADET